MGLIQDLLTENRYWTFWSADWSKRMNVFWEGKTKFDTIKMEMTKKLGNGFGYERQVQLQKPDIKYK